MTITPSGWQIPLAKVIFTALHDHKISFEDVAAFVEDIVSDGEEHVLDTTFHLPELHIEGHPEDVLAEDAFFEDV